MNNEYIGGMKSTFGTMFDYGINYCGIEGDALWDMMIVSGIGGQIEHSNPKYVAGRSGIELLRDIAYELDYRLEEDNKAISTHKKSVDYWCGWALIQYQNYSQLDFKRIHRLLKYEDLKKMYSKYHEMDITKFYECVDALKKCKKNKLKEQRELSGMSQSQLAQKSGTSLRTLQAYEQGLKNINNAQIGIVKKLAESMNCEIDEII